MSEAGQIVENWDQPSTRHAGSWQGGWPQHPEEFEAFVEAYQHRLIRYAWRRLRNFHDAQDVVQEVFVRAFTERKKCQKVTNVSGYLYRMVANLCTDLLRRGKYRAVPLDEARLLDLPTQSPDSLMLVIATEKLQRIDTLLERIPERQAEIIRLRVFDELGPTEIARMLGLPLTMVKARLRHGLEKLRRMMTQEWEE